MFSAFLFHLRAQGIKVGLNEWLTLLRALSMGFDRANLGSFYRVGRAILVHNESRWDDWDMAFASFFKGLESNFEIDDELLNWLADPKLPDREMMAALEAGEDFDLEALKQRFEDRLREQKERHDGGSHWIGTGGTSPHGNSGTHPNGIRVGGEGRSRSAINVASERRFQNLRSDRVLNTRDLGAALRRLRVLDRDEGPLELDIDESIKESARQGGEIELVFRPPKVHQAKVVLLMDVGGSMDPHAHLCERLFSAAHAARHFKAFKPLYFHNCVYDDVFTDMEQVESFPTEDLLRMVDQRWTLLFVGDAWMHPMELTHPGGPLHRWRPDQAAGITWLKRLRERCPQSIWLNPEPQRIWNAQSIQMVRQVFPMFELTLDGLSEGIDLIRQRKAHHPPRVH